jgi:hydrogenase/urease accessory protein HupE
MTRSIITLFMLIAGICALSTAAAHEARPAYLEISQAGAATYRIVWKQPTAGDLAIRLAPRLSNGWLERPPSDQYAAAGFLIRTWTIRTQTANPLAGSTLTVEGLENTITDVLVRIRLLDGQHEDAILKPESPRWAISSRPQAGMPMFLKHGVEHILGGIDHLLFVLGLLLIVRDRWMLLKAVSAFTAAHSITLALAMLANLSLPTPLVETLIPLSILFLGLEVLRAQRGGTSLTIRYPWAVAFAFGLIHGMGFANGLTALGFAAGDLLAALVLFNAGVEIGQLAFIALVLSIQRAISAMKLARPELQATIPAYLVGIAGAYWTLQSGAKWLGVV